MMAYTVKQLAQISGVSIRTLRFYDDIGILKPAYYGKNGYRYYEQTQLLILQQILFFRELSMPLKNIQQILDNSDFNTCDMLKSHKLGLEQKMERIKKLIVTLDKTIANLQGENKMSDKEMYDGFNPADLPLYDQIVIEEFGEVANSWIAKRAETTKGWGKAEWDQLTYAWNVILLKLTDAMHRGLPTNSPEVQGIIKEKYQLVKQLYAPTKEAYFAMIKINCHHPEYRKQYDFYDLKLAAYLEDAATLFANLEFKD
ncbi:MAG: MerR family transcriptional regulator [Gammaproteobacteria bacterium]|nr:MerR family transcriptional regulator [Gammaproteobacteria bacterium]